MLSGVSSDPMRLPLLLGFGLFLTARLSAAEPTAIERLAACLAGTFSSAEQARGDQNFHDVTLHVTRIWADRTDGPWFYAEQALTGAADHPYRQRIYQLATRDDGASLVHIFEPPDLLAATGAWRDPARLGQLNPANLASHEGCLFVLHVQPDGSFTGGTEGKGCSNTLRDASYATTEVTISAKETIMWERGYNAAGAQVWGANHGGYVFKRTE